MNQVTLSDQDISRIEYFVDSVEVIPSNFGNKDDIRSKEDIRRDNFVGKIGEVAFRQFMRESYGVHAGIDLSVYDEYQGDEQDALVLGYRFEIKSIKSGHWFLIEQDVLTSRKKRNLLPHYYVLCKVDWKEGRPSNVVNILGYTSIEYLANGKNVIQKGATLPNTDCKLKATNFAVHEKDLLNNWPTLLYRLKDMKVEE